MADETTPQRQDLRAFGVWCVMQHARPALVRALRAWGFRSMAKEIENSPSPSALRYVLAHVYHDVNPHVLLGPVRHELIRGVLSLQLAATMAGRGDGIAASLWVIGVFTSAAGALSWQRPWTRLNWRQRRTRILLKAVREQVDKRAALNLAEAPYRL